MFVYLVMKARVVVCAWAATVEAGETNIESFWIFLLIINTGYNQVNKRGKL
jgi:hypothetical protein